ncbi:MAG: substrate-binding domain-containing protein [Actinobacteria bacterium]|nr:substrate-binding domain-containing protein [Actinomycetota bacterium]
MKGIRMRIGLALMLVTLLAALVLAGCGGSSGGGSSSSTESAAGGVSKADLAKYEQELAKLWKGTYTEPQGPAFKPPSGKNVWVISTGQSIETAQNASAAMEEAGGKLGWSVHVFDGKFESSRELSGIQQAIAAGAEGIVLLYIDCAPVKAGLEQAKAAGIAVAGIESKDCNPSLETNVKFAQNQSWEEWSRGWGRGMMAWVIAKTHGEAKVIVAEETDLAVTREVNVGWEEQVKKCPTCEIVANTKFVGTEFGPPLQQKIEQALNSNPDANGFIPAYDAVMTSGGAAAAIRASGRLPEMAVMGGEGSVPGIEQIYDESGMKACIGIPTAQTGWEAIAVLARAFAGLKPGDGNSGVGWQICEKGHNLPPKGETYQPPLNYVPVYEKMWGLK